MSNSVKERLKLVEKSVDRLRGVEVNDEDFYHFQGVKHTLQEAAEACIHTAGHIIAAEGFERQNDYADYFQELGSRGILDQALADRMQEMARFRNLVVHRYSEVEEEQLQEILDESLEDLTDFIAQVDGYLEERD